MTIEKLKELLALAPDEAIKGLKVSSETIPLWSDLEKEYNPLKHSIWDTTLYPPKINENGGDDFKRTALALQKLAVSRISQSMFATPTERIYAYDKASESQQKAVDLLELLYRTENYIDSENIERAKKLNASCQIVTIWGTYEKPSLYNGEPAKFKLMHKTYAEIDGYTIFAQKDDYGNLLVVTIMYKDAANVEYADVYANLETPQFIRYVKLDVWSIDPLVSKPLEVFPAVYSCIPEPVWGGAAGTNLVEQLEEMESSQGMYIKKNALPAFTIDYGELSNSTKGTAVESNSDSRRIIVVGKGGNMKDVTWDGADKAITGRYNRLRNAFFEQVQMPDISFANMINSNTSAENKELLFADAKAKAIDLGGEWAKMFYEELLVVKNFAKIIMPSYAADYDTISVRSVVKPYSIKSNKENAEYVAVGGAAMSLSTKVRTLGAVDDVEQEVEAISAEQSAASNQLL